MVTGVETAGLVLATLPLTIEAVKVYAGGAKTIKDVLLPQHRDEKLQEFYEDLWIELHLLSQQIRVIVDALPGLTDQRKSELAKGLRATDFAPRSIAVQALKSYFNSESDYVVFEQLLDKITRLLCRLIENKYYNIRHGEMSSEQLLKKLQAFVKSRDDKTTSSTLKERLNLRMKEKDLQTRVANLEKWNKKLRTLIKQNDRFLNGTTSIEQTAGASRDRPTIALSRMPQILHKSLMKHSGCPCGDHRAMFCLQMPHHVHRAVDPAEIEFSLFLSLPETESVLHWQESKIHVRRHESTKVKFKAPDSSDPLTERKAIAQLCQEVSSVYNQGHCLCLLAEDEGDKYHMWRLRSVKRQLECLDTLEAASLAACLPDFMNLTLAEKRCLALRLAYSLVLLDGSPWLQERWTKNHISFFRENTKTKRFDFSRPYVSSSIRHVMNATTTTSFDVLHPNLSILSLGILLIEIETGKPIEHFRSADDLSNGMEHDNTDFAVADRVARSLSTCSPDYQEAIFACLDVPWRSAGKKVTLTDPETRDAVYETIISRLESEVEYLGCNMTTT